jgi:glutamate formiminotransferase/glutamate formiminotransferase/formiminotetrahydrofolate cyclodeaminase
LPLSLSEQLSPQHSATDDPKTPLEAVPNVSEGEDEESLRAIGHAFSRGCRLLDVHSDPDYGRSVFTLVGAPQALGDAIVAGARETIARIDIRSHRGVHPCVGALDVVPIVYLRAEDRETAHDEALAVANRLAAELDLPIFLYGELAVTAERSERSFFRDGGVRALSSRLSAGELRPDFGPPRTHPTAGAVLVAARPPLVAFNFELETTDIEAARRVAGRLRERGGGLPGVRAIGVKLERQEAIQLSTNVHDPFAVPLRALAEAVRREAALEGVGVLAGQLVGLAPASALEGFPADLPLRDFDPKRHILDNRV